MTSEELALQRAQRKRYARQALHDALETSLHIHCMKFVEGTTQPCAMTQHNAANTCPSCRVRALIRRALTYMEDPIRKPKRRIEHADE